LGVQLAETQTPGPAFGGLAVSAYLEAALDCVVVADASGCVVAFNPAAERTFGYSRDEALGRTLAELIVPPAWRKRHSEAFARFATTGEGRLLGQRLQLTGMRADGSEFPVELALSRVEGDPVLVCGALRDLTDVKRAEEDLRRHAAEHAALRRVATLVAHGALPAEVFAAVAEGVAELLGVPAISMVRFESDGTASKVAGWGESPFPVGARWALDDPSVMALVAETGRPARIEDYATVPGRQAERIRASGVRSAVGVPLTVEGRSWGVVIAFATDPQQLAADAEERLARFTELVATAIANSQARDDLQQLAGEQAALRRVATLIAREAQPADVFAAVAKEVALTLDVPLSAVVRFEADRTATEVGAWGEENPFPVGTSWPLDEHSVSGQVARTRKAAHVDDYSAIPGEIASRLAREAGIRTAVGVPILVDGIPWGAMMALSTAQRPLGEDIEVRLGAFTELIATAIANTQARDDLRRLADEQAALRRVATLVAERATPNEVFAAVAGEVARLLEVPAISMVRFERDETSTAIAVWGEANPFGVGAKFDPWPGVMLQVRRSGRPARLEDFAYSTGPTTARLQAAHIHSGVGVPITVEGRIWGTIIALATGGGSLPNGVAERLSSFTDLVATAIANAEARDGLDGFAREQEALRRVATITAAGSSPQEVFDAVVVEIKELLDLPVVALTRYEHDGMVLMMAAAGPHPFQKGTRWPVHGLPVAAMVLERGEPAYLEEYVTDDPTTGPAIETARVRSGLAVPIMVGGKVWGTISTASTDVPLPPDAERRLVGFTELVATAVLNAQARDDLSDLADEQAALRRVATLVAEGAGSPAVYDAICEETGLVIGATSVNLCHFTPDRFNLTMAGWSARDTHVPRGTRLPLEGGTINELVHETSAPARVESYADAEGALAELIRKRGIKCEVAAPVIVDGRMWGSIIAGWDTDGAAPSGAERRLAGFAELVGTAVSNALARSELVASRARIVTAADEARRRIERNLHDGVQQQLVSLQLELKAVDAGVPPELRQTHDDIDRVQGILGTVLDDVREIAQGVHPATLSQWGLGPAVRTLARRSPIPVELELQVPDRLPQSVEIAVYYAVSEALANVAKHARATYAAVTVNVGDGWLHAVVRDDGVGGVDTARGTGIAGLVDRVEALGGRLSLASAPQQGTTVAVSLPLGDESADGP
jgi:PAS domain S-box-containing protein